MILVSDQKPDRLQEDSPEDGSIILEGVKLSRSFPGVRALIDVDLELRRGEVHALVGENGAGKSTMIKILSGVLQPDSGEIRIKGHPVRLPRPQVALQKGISTVHQEFNYCPDLNALENLYLGRSLPLNRFGLVNWAAAHRRAKEVFDSLGFSLDMRVPVSRLSATNRKLVEVARGLLFRADILILDEPTAALPEDEVDHLFAVVRRLRGIGVSTIYISHHLDEVFEISDRVTVLRDGRKVGTRVTGDLSRKELIRMMVGREVNSQLSKQTVTIGEPILEVKGLSRQGEYTDVNFRLHRGEILGLAGLIGAGRSEVAQAIAGIFPADSGTVTVEGQVKPISNVRDAIAAGIAYVPEDRQYQGVVLGMSIVDNMTLPILEKLSQGLILSRKDQTKLTQEYIDRFRIVCASPHQPVGRLSGGNQQKCVLGKWVMVKPRVLILDEPTRGIDIGAKAEVHNLMSAMAAEGMGIIMISSELPEILQMSDRIIVLHEGSITAELRREEADQEKIMHAATGQQGVDHDGQEPNP